MIKQIHQKLINKEISATELTRDYLAKIKNSDLNAFITVTEDEAIKQAEYVDELISSREELPILAGIPASIKDVIMTAGIKTTAASKILEKYIAPYDATIVAKLKSQGVVILGKNNCDEFAMGGSNENSAYGVVRNPCDKERVPGGSSGGGAASVADDLSVYAIGTDTGGSVRQPAAFCGVVGFKPTYGAISRYGLIAMASSLDQIGIISKCVEDARIVFDVIKGLDPLDSTSVISNQKLGIRDFKDLKIGIPKEYFTLLRQGYGGQVSGMDKEVESSVRNVIKKCEESGAKIVEVSLPHTEYALAVYYIIQPAEASANLARYDGIRYGQTINNKQQTTDLIDIYKKTRAEFLGDEVKRRIMLGTYTLSAGYYDAYYKKAQQIRTLIKKDFEEVYKDVDLLITPTTPTPAFKLGEMSEPLQMYLQDVFTVPINVAGLPAISIPCGKTRAGLPIGVQLIGPWMGEDLLFNTGQSLESVLK